MDLRYALRSLGRNPGYAVIVVLILAAGIGANTAMFSIVDGVLLRPLPFREPDRLFAVQQVAPRFAKMAPDFPVNAQHVREWRKRWTAAEQIGLIDGRTHNLTSGGEPERVNSGLISANLFPLLGVRPQIGRGFVEEEERAGRDAVVILSDSLWRRRFHADPNVIGQKIMLNDRPNEVIGVMPAGLKVPRTSQLQSLHISDEDSDLWKPLVPRDDVDLMGDFNYGCIARLKKGVSEARALEELNALEVDLMRGYPEKVELYARLAPLQQEMTGRSRTGLLLLFSAVSAVLLIVCVNVANLMLARATGRRREFAIRSAIGASSRRLLRQMLTESLVVASIGGALGIGLAYLSLRVILANAPEDVARLSEVHIDARVLGVACLLTLFSAVLFGLVPAWRASRIDPQEGMRSGGRSATESRQSGRLRTVLVALEVALSTICLAAAGLLLNSFVRLMHIDKGFDAEHVISVELVFSGARYTDEKRDEFLRKAIEDIQPMPGVTAVGVSNILPLGGEGNNNLLVQEGVEMPLFERPLVDMRSVNGDYFHAMGIPLRAGRTFEEGDHKHGVAIVGETTARKLWPGQSPMGKRFRFGENNAPMLEVIGVAGDVRGNGLQKQPQDVVYMPYWYRGRTAMSLVVRTAMSPSAMAGAVRAELRKLDAELPVPQFRTMEEIVSASVAERRFQLSLVLVFAGVALVLACLGIFGVVSYTVAQRRGEMGIRLALGATAGNLRGMVLRQGLAPVAVGLACGIAGALAMGQVLQGLLFGVKASDPWTLAGVTLLLLGVAAGACYIPAMRAARADPLRALRYE